MSNSNETETGPTPKGRVQLFTKHIYSDSTYRVHIFKVLLGILIFGCIVAFVVLGFFFPECNGTQERGFYSCSCKAGSALDQESGLCKCLDDGNTLATTTCDGATNDVRYIFTDARTGEWQTSASCS